MKLFIGIADNVNYNYDIHDSLIIKVNYGVNRYKCIYYDDKVGVYIDEESLDNTKLVFDKEFINL